MSSTSLDTLPTLASSIAVRRPAPFPSAAPSHADEEYINRSLLDSLNEQADAEPHSSSDSEAPSASANHMGSMTGGSSVGSPSLPYHISMQSQQQQGPRPDSPGTNSILPSYLTSPPHNADSFAQASSQKTVNNSYQMYNSMNSNIHTPLGTDFSSVLSPEHDAALNPQSTTNGFSSPPYWPSKELRFQSFPSQQQ